MSQLEKLVSEQKLQIEKLKDENEKLRHILLTKINRNRRRQQRPTTVNEK
jgi:hypothetical protein